MKLLDKADGQVNYASLWVPFSAFDKKLAEVEEEGKVKVYIELEF